MQTENWQETVPVQGSPEQGSGREAVGVFHDKNAFYAAIEELEHRAFPRHAFSVLARAEELERAFGDPHPDRALLIDNPDTPRATGVRPEEKVEGRAAMIGAGAYFGIVGAAIAAGAISVPATLTAAAIGGLGGVGAGAIFSRILGEKIGSQFDEQIRDGGILLWVQTPDPEKEEIACAILSRHGADHIGVHMMQ